MIDFAHLTAVPADPVPLGAAPDNGGVRFALVSRHATRVWLALFAQARDARPAIEFELDDEQFRHGDIWSAFVAGPGPGALYAYRVEGTDAPEQGILFAPERFLLDPYAKAIAGITSAAPKSVVVAPRSTDGVRRPRLPISHAIIYEVHVAGFTRHPSSAAFGGTAPPGTYRALIDKLPYLKDLGVTAIELLPVATCGEDVVARTNPITGERLANYWGYNPIGLFAPDARFASPSPGEAPLAAVEEFAALVAAAHAAGMEVILDVVFNHTAEGSLQKPPMSFAGIDRPVYYIHSPEGKPLDFSGCGNTFNVNHPVVQDIVMDCLHYWVNEFGVDGFRFDLAAVLHRGRDGRLLESPPLLDRITEAPLLRHVKLIAEPWDCGSAYFAGHFGPRPWCEWNDRFRDDVRRFWRNEPFAKNDFVQRFMGSPDLYRAAGRPPSSSINYVTAHDGFTLRDLVSYAHKHNEANGEDNRDGADENLSQNCGVEGESEDPAILALRLRLHKSFLASLFLSLGTPMLLGGDEFGRTQQGNNNAYCQDNPISWHDWRLIEKEADLHAFCRGLILFRKQYPVFNRDAYFITKIEDDGDGVEILWMNPAGQPESWSSPEGTVACCIAAHANAGVAIVVLFNPSDAPVSFTLPAGTWLERFDTARPFAAEPRTLLGAVLIVAPKAIVVLTSP